MSPTSHQSGIAVLAVLLLLTTGCGAIRGERVISGVSSEPGEVALADVNVPTRSELNGATYVDEVSGTGAFAFTAFELSTREPRFGQDLVAEGKVIISFVVPSCPICQVEGPEIARSAVENPDVTYVIVHSGGTVEAYEEYIDSSGLALENVVHIDDSPGLVWSRFGIVQQPSNILVDSNGGVSFSRGALGEDGLSSVIGSM